MRNTVLTTLTTAAKSGTLGLVFAVGLGTAAAALTVTEVTDALDTPWAVAVLPDGDMLVTERGGTLRRVTADGQVSAPLEGVPPVLFAGQGGLMDIVLDPDFADNRWVYLTLAHGTARENATRIVRGRLADGGLDDLEVIFTATPWKRTAMHYGGRMAFLPDGTLLVTIGDAFDQREESQNPGSHLGTVARIAADGSVPADNPFVGRDEGLDTVWSYGHRNAQAILYDAETDTVWSNEHGPRGGDEINRIEPGKNYGWPAVTYGIDYSGAVISPYTELPDMQAPLLHWTPSIAPSAMILYRGDLFPDWQGDFLVTALAAAELRRVDMDGDRVAGQESLLAEEGDRLRDIVEAADGSILIVTDSGRLLRLTP